MNGIINQVEAVDYIGYIEGAHHVGSTATGEVFADDDGRLVIVQGSIDAYQHA